MCSGEAAAASRRSWCKYVGSTGFDTSGQVARTPARFASTSPSATAVASQVQRARSA